MRKHRKEDSYHAAAKYYMDLGLLIDFITDQFKNP